MARSLVERGSPPSSYAIADVVEGKPDAWGRTASLTATRALFIAPGLYLAGIRGPQLAFASLLSSSTITLWLLGVYSSKARRRDRLE